MMQLSERGWGFPIGTEVRIVAGIVMVGCVVVLFWFGALESPVGGALAGLVAFIGSWVLAGAVAERREDRRIEKIRKRRLGRLREPVRIRVAQIASDLVPLIDELPPRARQNGVLRIVGYDGNYIRGRNGNLLKKAFVRWIREGLTVEYILTNPDTDAGSAYSTLLSQEDEAARPRLRVLCVGKYEREDFENRGIDLESLKSKHPTLFYSRTGDSAKEDEKTIKAMWIEEDHEPGSNVAYDVTYVSPDAMGDEEEELYDHHDKEIESLKELCDTILPESESRHEAVANPESGRPL